MVNDGAGCALTTSARSFARVLVMRAAGGYAGAAEGNMLRMIVLM